MSGGHLFAASVNSGNTLTESNPSISAIIGKHYRCNSQKVVIYSVSFCL